VAEALEDQDNVEKKLELQEREAVMLTREQTLEKKIREILKREQLVSKKEERIEEFLKQLQHLGLSELAESLEKAFESVITDLKKDEGGAQLGTVGGDKLPDGGAFAAAGYRTIEPEEFKLAVSLEDLAEDTDEDPEVLATRLLDNVRRELEKRERGEIYDRADRMRYLAETFMGSGNHPKAVEFARRALVVLAHFA
jgi:hypothetical protein